jgi:hypothetical protein
MCATSDHLAWKNREAAPNFKHSNVVLRWVGLDAGFHVLSTGLIDLLDDVWFWRSAGVSRVDAASIAIHAEHCTGEVNEIPNRLRM